MNDGETFNSIPLPPQMIPFGAYGNSTKLAANSENLWILFNNYTSDTLYIYKTIDNGDSYQKLEEFFVDQVESNFAGIPNNNELYVSFTKEVLGYNNVYFYKISGSLIGNKKLIYSTALFQLWNRYKKIW